MIYVIKNVHQFCVRNKATVVVNKDRSGSGHDKKRVMVSNR